MTYTPSDKSDVESVLQQSRSLFIPHLAWIEFIHSRFNATRHMRKNLTNLFIHLLGSTFRNAHLMRYVYHIIKRSMFQSILTNGLDFQYTFAFKATKVSYVVVGFEDPRDGQHGGIHRTQFPYIGL